MVPKIQKVSPVLNVSSIEESFDWFEKLGWQRSFSWNSGGMLGEGPEAPVENEHGEAGFGGVCCGDITMFLCVDGQGQRGNAEAGETSKDGMWMSWWLESKSAVDEFHETAVKNNMTVPHPPTDEPWGVREFHLRHPDGHMFRVGCGVG